MLSWVSWAMTLLTQVSMMRALPVSLGLLAAAALAAGSADAGAPVRATRASLRSTRVHVSPAPGDLALVELSFNGHARVRLSAHALRVAVSGPFGDDYLASAAPLRGARAFVLVVDRPSPLEDPASVALLVRAQRGLGAPRTTVVTDPFSDPRVASRALCALPHAGASLSAAGLRALGSHGTAISGFSAAAAVAEAFDVACGLPYERAFREVVTRPAAVPVAPAPAPPAPRPPGCTPCPPEPGIACPLALAPDICEASLAPPMRPQAASAH